jgi:hypothetical protein
MPTTRVRIPSCESETRPPPLVDGGPLFTVLLTLQFPFADLRTFIPDGGGRAAKPAWPAAQAGVDFVHGVGGVKERRRGGMAGWIGEDVHCEAAGCVRFAAGLPRTLRIPARRRGDAPAIIHSEVAFRRFYSDGLSLGKIEVGFSFPRRGNAALPAVDWHALLAKITGSPLGIPLAGGVHATTLDRAGPPLAARLQRATTTRQSPHVSDTAAWLIAGRPVLCIEACAEELPTPWPFVHRTTPINRGPHELIVSSYQPPLGPAWPLYVLRLSNDAFPRTDLPRARAVRIALLRLHAQHECIRIVLESIATNRLVVPRRSPISDAVQQYLIDALQKLEGAADAAIPFLDPQALPDVRRALYSLSVTQSATLIQAIRALDIRRQILTRVTTYIENCTITMDTYNISGGQQGAVGPHANVSGNTFTQVHPTLAPAELAQLATELEQLRVALLSRAKTAEETLAAGKVAEAQIAAKDADSNKVVAALKSAGKFALDVAKDIGVSVAAEVIKRALHLPA